MRSCSVLAAFFAVLYIPRTLELTRQSEKYCTVVYARRVYENLAEMLPFVAGTEKSSTVSSNLVRQPAKYLSTAVTPSPKPCRPSKRRAHLPQMAVVTGCKCLAVPQTPSYTVQHSMTSHDDSVRGEGGSGRGQVKMEREDDVVGAAPFVVSVARGGKRGWKGLPLSDLSLWMAKRDTVILHWSDALRWSRLEEAQHFFCGCKGIGAAVAVWFREMRTGDCWVGL